MKKTIVVPIVLLTIMIALSGPTATFASWGNEFKINLYSDGGYFSPSVTKLANNYFAVSWIYDGVLKGAVYDSTGNKITGDLFIQQTSSSTSDNSIAALPDGKFVVVWQNNSSNRPPFAICARLYDNTGNPLSDQFVVESKQTSISYIAPQASSLSNGNFIISWKQGASSVYECLAVVYNLNGAIVKPKFSFLSDTSRMAFSLKGLPNDKFAVCWNQTNFDLLCKIISNVGITLKDAFKVNILRSNLSVVPQIASITPDTFVVSYTAADVYDNNDVYFQRINSAGEKIGSETRVNNYTTNNQWSESIAAISSGYVITWRDDQKPVGGHRYEIFCQIYDLIGAKVGGEMVVNNSTTNDQIMSKIAGLSDNRFVVVWQGQQAYPNWDAYGRIYSPTQITMPTQVLPANGSTSASTSVALQWASGGGSQWSLQVLKDGASYFMTTVTGSPTSTLTGLAPGNYTWRVAACDDSGNNCTAWTGYWSFTVLQITMPTQTSPANGSTTASTSMALQWTSGGGSQWSLQVLKDGASYLMTTVTGNPTRTLTGLTPGNYTWRVSTCDFNGGNCSAWTGYWSFNIRNPDLYLNLSNVTGGLANLTGVWRIDIVNRSSSQLVKQVFSSVKDNIKITGLLVGVYFLNIYYQHNDGQAVWEFWGDQDFDLSNSDATINFKREMPWCSNVSKPSTVILGANLTVRTTVKNEIAGWVRVQVEGMCGTGKIYVSQTKLIAPSQSEAFDITIENLNLSKGRSFLYWVKATQQIDDPNSMILTDHGYIPNFVDVTILSNYGSEMILFRYRDGENNLWEVGADKKSTVKDIYMPKNSFKNIKIYKNGTVAIPSPTILNHIYYAISREFEGKYSNYSLARKFDNNLGIWTAECSYAWPCHTALIDFDNVERRNIYKDIIWSSITSENLPNLLSEIYLPKQNGAPGSFNSSTPISHVSKIDKYHNAVATLFEFSSKATTIAGKVLDLNETLNNANNFALFSNRYPDLAKQMSADLKSGGTLYFLSDTLKILNFRITTELEFSQHTTLMELVNISGRGSDRIATLIDAYRYVKNMVPELDQEIYNSIIDVKNEFETELAQTREEIRKAFFLSNIPKSLLKDIRYISTRLVEISEKLPKVGNLLKNDVVKFGLLSGINFGIDLFKLYYENTDDWRRIHLAVSLNTMLYNFTSNPRYTECFADGFWILNSIQLEKNYPIDIYDLQSSFQWEYFNRGLQLIDSDWMGLSMQAVSSSIATIKAPHLYALAWSSTAFNFGAELGKSAINIFYGDEIKAINEEIKSIENRIVAKNLALNQWAEILHAFVMSGGTLNQLDDTDQDGMPDAWEIAYGLNMYVNDSQGDIDSDGIKNIDEFLLKTNPAVYNDSIRPNITILNPAESVNHFTRSALLSISGNASDNLSVANVIWSTDRGGSGAFSGTSSWSGMASLLSGVNVITVTARDAAGNTGTDTLTVTYTPPNIDIGVFRPSTGWWYLDLNGDLVWSGCGTDGCSFFGTSADVPATGDWDGDGVTDIGVFRPSTGRWYLDLSGDQQWSGCGADGCFYYGTTADTAVAGDWNNDGFTEIGVFRPSTGWWYLDFNGDNEWSGCAVDKCIYFGTANDKPVAGDWNNSGYSQIGVFRPSTGMWYLDVNGNGLWDGCGTDRCITFGTSGDLPVTGDWNGDGIYEVGTFRPTTGYWYLDLNGNGQWDGCGVDGCYYFGTAADLPVVGLGGGFNPVP